MLQAGVEQGQNLKGEFPVALGVEGVSRGGSLCVIKHDSHGVGVWGSDAGREKAGRGFSPKAERCSTQHNTLTGAPHCSLAPHCPPQPPLLRSSPTPPPLPSTACLTSRLHA